MSWTIRKTVAAGVAVVALGAAGVNVADSSPSRPTLTPRHRVARSPIPRHAGRVVPAGRVRGAVRHMRAAGLARPLRVLVTNDDGIGADGIDALVEGLRRLPNTEVTIVAPATNQSGAGDAFTETALTVTNGTTLSGRAGKAVAGKPADTVFWAIHTGLVPRPDIVVSGINFGQNMGDAVTLSGTVGAATTAARFGIPAVAISQGIPPISYTDAADIATVYVGWVGPELVSTPPTTRIKTVVNINVPSCPDINGVVLVPVGRLRTVSGYTGGPTDFTPTINERGYGDFDCESGATTARDDIDAYNKGLVGISLIRPLLSDL